MRNNHASVARRAHRAQRPRPTQLVAPKLHEASFRACVLDDPARNCDAHSDPADGFADRVVVREVLEKRVEATDSLQRFAAHRDRRTEARPCQAQRKANQLDAAQASFKRAVELKGDEADYHFNLATTYRRREKTDVKCTSRNHSQSV